MEMEKGKLMRVEKEGLRIEIKIVERGNEERIEVVGRENGLMKKKKLGDDVGNGNERGKREERIMKKDMNLEEKRENIIEDEKGNVEKLKNDIEEGWNNERKRKEKSGIEGKRLEEKEESMKGEKIEIDEVKRIKMVKGNENEKIIDGEKEEDIIEINKKIWGRVGKGRIEIRIGWKKMICVRVLGVVENINCK